MKKSRMLMAVIMAMILLAGCSSVSVSTTPAETKAKIVKLATAAAVIYASKNKASVSAALPYVKDALALAKSGAISTADLTTLVRQLKILTENDDVKTALALFSAEFANVTITANTVNADVVQALEAIVAGLEAGAAE